MDPIKLEKACLFEREGYKEDDLILHSADVHLGTNPVKK